MLVESNEKFVPTRENPLPPASRPIAGNKPISELDLKQIISQTPLSPSAFAAYTAPQKTEHKSFFVMLSFLVPRRAQHMQSKIVEMQLGQNSKAAKPAYDPSDIHMLFKTQPGKDIYRA